MKKLLKLLVLAALVAGVVWWIRDRFIPVPRTTAGPVPPFRPASTPEPASQPATGQRDDLTEVTGIGPVYAERLGTAGYGTFRSLAAADPKVIAGITQAGEQQAADWIRQAKEMT